MSTSVATSVSQDQAAMNSWLWQQYTAAAAAAASSTTSEFGSSSDADALQPNAADSMSNGGMIVYQLNADGTQSAANYVPSSGDLLEPGEVRLPVTVAQTNGVAGDLTYNGSSAGAEFHLGGSSAWLRQTSSTVGSTVDSEKQLLRGALVDKVREIQRLTRELEQAYALIHQLKQHNDFLHRQWGQIQITSDAATQ